MAASEFATAVAKYDGWFVTQEREAKVREAAGSKNAVAQVLVDEGHYLAAKRHGLTLVEFADTTPEGVLVKIAEWENVQAAATATPRPHEKAYKESEKNSNAATRSLLSPTGGNKPAAGSIEV